MFLKLCRSDKKCEQFEHEEFFISNISHTLTKCLASILLSPAPAYGCTIFFITSAKCRRQQDLVFNIFFVYSANVSGGIKTGWRRRYIPGEHRRMARAQFSGTFPIFHPPRCDAHQNVSPNWERAMLHDVPHWHSSISLHLSRSRWKYIYISRKQHSINESNSEVLYHFQSWSIEYNVRRLIGSCFIDDAHVKSIWIWRMIYDGGTETEILRGFFATHPHMLYLW